MAARTATEMNLPEREREVELYFESQIAAIGGGSRRLSYRGRRGCADQLAVIPKGRLYLVELKRPVGGRYSVHQTEDKKWLASYGIEKVELHTREAVDRWIAKVRP